MNKTRIDEKQGTCVAISAGTSRRNCNVHLPNKGQLSFTLRDFQFLYLTQALAQDQKAAMEQLLCCCPGLERIKVRLSFIYLNLLVIYPRQGSNL
jgi:hypothetical protein